MVKPQIILGIETSCDETAASLVQKVGDRVQILSNVVASSAALQAKYGGVIPEQAAREQLSSIIPVINEALEVGCEKLDIKKSTSKISHLSPLISKIDAIAVTQGPGLIGSLLVGVETAKTLAVIWNKPLIPVNHLLGHFYANWTLPQQPKFPCIGLLVSGGHTDLILMTDHGEYQYLGGTRDDAAGECFDKCARLLGLPYPGGPVISKLAQQGNPKAFKLPRPMINSNDLDFSFSGLKTAVANLVSSEGVRGVTRVGAPHRAPTSRAKSRERTSDGADERQDPEQIINNLAASLEAAIVEVLVKKTVEAAQIYKVDQIIVAGGVAANQTLAKELARADALIPPPNLCTDNAVYIATAAFYNFHPIDPLALQANPSLSLAK